MKCPYNTHKYCNCAKFRPTNEATLNKTGVISVSTQRSIGAKSCKYCGQDTTQDVCASCAYSLLNAPKLEDMPIGVPFLREYGPAGPNKNHSAAMRISETHYLVAGHNTTELLGPAWHNDAWEDCIIVDWFEESSQASPITIAPRGECKCYSILNGHENACGWYKS